MTETVLERSETLDICHEFTKTTFRKTSRLPVTIERPDGTSVLWHRLWNHERIGNEVKALQLIARETTIPIPRLLDHGVYDDGRQYLVTELIEGETLYWFPRGCAQPDGVKHTENDTCTTCFDIAHSNAIEFMNTVFFPQLEKLKSHTRGLDGFVMPPSWLLPDFDAPWKGNIKAFSTLPLTEPEYVFQHGDLGANNIIMDTKTLKVNGVIDWEFAGFYPPGMERWTGTFDRTTYSRRARNIAPFVAKFLKADFLECCDPCEDKEQLQRLIEEGQCPDPDQLRRDGAGSLQQAL